MNSRARDLWACAGRGVRHVESAIVRAWLPGSFERLVAATHGGSRHAAQAMQNYNARANARDHGEEVAERLDYDYGTEIADRYLSRYIRSLVTRIASATVALIGAAVVFRAQPDSLLWFGAVASFVGMGLIWLSADHRLALRHQHGKFEVRALEAAAAASFRTIRAGSAREGRLQAVVAHMIAGETAATLDIFTVLLDEADDNLTVGELLDAARATAR